MIPERENLRACFTGAPSDHQDSGGASTNGLRAANGWSISEKGKWLACVIRHCLVVTT